MSDKIPAIAFLIGTLCLAILATIMDCTPDNGQIVKQWYLRQPPLRTEPEICN